MTKAKVEFKAGDRVFYVDGYGPKPTVIAEKRVKLITPKGYVRTDDGELYDADGGARGDMVYRSRRIVPHTAELERRWHYDKLRSTLRYGISDKKLNALPVERVELMGAILNGDEAAIASMTRPPARISVQREDIGNGYVGWRVRLYVEGSKQAGTGFMLADRNSHAEALGYAQVVGDLLGIKVDA